MPDYEKLIERLMREEIPQHETRLYGRHARVPVNPDGIEAAEAISTLLKERDALKEEIRSLSRHS
jgi:hypothetical protein